MGQRATVLDVRGYIGHLNEACLSGYAALLESQGNIRIYMESSFGGMRPLPYEGQCVDILGKPRGGQGAGGSLHCYSDR